MIEKNSPTWRAIAAWANERIEEARQQIEAPGLDTTTTEFQRGRIATLRSLLELTAEKPVVSMSRETPLY